MPGNSSEDTLAPPDSNLQWLTLFDNLNAKDGKKEGKDGPDNKKRLSVERIYQKKTQLEHILLRPDTYIGSVEPVTQNMWVYDGEDVGMVNRSVTFVPGLYKIFDEILVNAADNKQRDSKMDCIKVDIDSENNCITIWNNGKGIPVVEHKVEKMFVPALIFGHLLTSSNYNDEEKKVTGGRNGYGAKLCNIFSLKFSVETACNESKKCFKQTWTDNMGKSKDAKIIPFKGSDYTKISFTPDLEKFKMTSLDADIVSLMSRRAYDIAGASNGVKVYLNGKKLPIKGFKDYIEQYIKDQRDDNDQPLKLVHEVVNNRWEIGVTQSSKGFQQISFVNSIATTKGGRHVDHVTDQICTKLIEVVKKKNKNGVSVKSFQVKNHMWVFINCLIENPTFDSQTKENMTLQSKSFGSKCAPTEKFISAVNKCGIIESILLWVKFKTQAQMNRKCYSSKHSKLKGVPKLEDANDAGTKNSVLCTLILTEGDSAKTLAVSGLGVVGRDRYGVFPLKGKMLNVREATYKQIMENAEINNIIKIMGLQYKKQYKDIDDLKSLRYGKLMIMADQDQDGSHIKGLLINFIHHNWPSLLQLPFLEEFITPIVKVTKGKEETSFYSLPEFEEWKAQTDNWHKYNVKYYKGLGTSTAKEAKEYFSDMPRHRIPFTYSGPDDDAAITLAFSRKKIEERKEWLTNGMNERKQRRLMGLPELYLYGKGTKNITYNDFINKELILFSNTDNERSIPSLVDGFKPGQRKVIFTCIKRNDKREVKVAQLAGSIAEMSAYHHGENSLQSTIVNLAQNFVGSNNINLLQPLGQFGTRLQGGKDAASPRYIFTKLSSLTRLIFHPNDDATLKYLNDDNQKIEPEWYCPIIPMVLVNGTEGIGTGWSTKVPNCNPRTIVENIKLLMRNEEIKPMYPWYKNFLGSIEFLSDQRYIFNGEIAIVDNTTVEIFELPVFVWTQAYKETVLEPMLHGSEKITPLITDYKEYHTDTTVRFVVTMTEDKLANAEAEGLHKVFKLQSTFATSSMVLFDSNGVLHRYASVDDILKEFYQLRLERYAIRKDYLEGMLMAESSKLDNQARFILEKIQGKIVVENKPKKEVIRMLTERGYDSDPIKAWKEAQEKLPQDEDDRHSSDDENESKNESKDNSGPDYDYLMGMSMWSLVKENADELLKKRDAKAEQLNILRKKSPTDLWKEDLDAFITELNKVEEQERMDEASGNAGIMAKVSKTGKGRVKKIALLETKPSVSGRRVVPIIDAFLKQKAEKAAEKKVKAKEKKTSVSREDGDEGDENDEEKNNSTLKIKRERKKNVGGGSGGRKLKQTTLNFKSPDKKKKKRHAWSDSESGNDNSGSDLDTIPIDVIPRERVPKRAAAAAVKFNLSDSENEKSNDSDSYNKRVRKPEAQIDSDADNEFSPSKMEFETNNVDHEPPVSGGVTVSSDSDAELPKKEIPKKPIKKPTAVKPVTVSSDSDDESPKKEVSKKPIKKPTVVKCVTVSSDSDAESPTKQVPKKPIKKPTVVKPKKIKEVKPKSVATEAKPKVSRPRKKKMIESDGSGDDFASKPKTSTAVIKKKIVKKDSVSDQLEPEIFSKLAATKDSDVSDDEFVPKAAISIKQRTKKSSDISDDELLPIEYKKSSDVSDNEFIPTAIPKKQPAKPKEVDSDDLFSRIIKKKRPLKKNSDQSDVSEDEFKPKKPVTKRKKKNSDSENEGMDVGGAVSRARPGRTKAPIKYNFGDSEDSD